MATIGKITEASNGTAAIRYAEGKGKLKDSTKQFLLKLGVDRHIVDQLHDRAVVKSGLNVDPEFATMQMKATRNAYSTHGKEATRIIQSFSTNDLNPATPADWQKANEIGLEFAQKAFPDYQVAVYTQLDGVGHKLHNHIVVNMPNLRTGKKYHEHQSWQRLSALNDDISRVHGLSVIDRSKAPKERKTMSERQLSAKNAYVWKDDLRKHIDNAMLDSSVSSYKDFSAILASYGIITNERGKSLSYEFLDAKNKHRRARGTTLGADYEKESIFNELERKARQSTANREVTSIDNALEQREQQTKQRESTITRFADGERKLNSTIQPIFADYEAKLDQQRTSRFKRLTDTIKSITNGLQRLRNAIPELTSQIKQRLASPFYGLKPDGEHNSSFKLSEFITYVNDNKALIPNFTAEEITQISTQLPVNARQNLFRQSEVQAVKLTPRANQAVAYLTKADGTKDLLFNLDSFRSYDYHGHIEDLRVIASKRLGKGTGLTPKKAEKIINQIQVVDYSKIGTISSLVEQASIHTVKRTLVGSNLDDDFKPGEAIAGYKDSVCKTGLAELKKAVVNASHELLARVNDQIRLDRSKGLTQVQNQYIQSHPNTRGR